MSTKQMTAQEVVSRLDSGMTLGIGGWGSRRKPMALVHAIARSDLKDLTLVSYGGPDVGLLCALGKVRKLVFGFVSLDSIPLEPHFRKARQTGSLAEVMELDEGMLLQGLRAAAWGLPYLPVRAGLGSAAETTNTDLKRVSCPYTGQPLLAMPALHLDAALIHLHRSDLRGNAQYLNEDPYFDDWFAMAATHTYLSAERLELDDTCSHRNLIQRMMVTGVVHAPGGAGFTDCSPDYPRDEAAQRDWVATAKDDSAFEAWCRAHLRGEP